MPMLPALRSPSEGVSGKMPPPSGISCVLVVCSWCIHAEILVPIFGGAIHAVNLRTGHRLTFAQFLASSPDDIWRSRVTRPLPLSPSVYAIGIRHRYGPSAWDSPDGYEIFLHRSGARYPVWRDCGKVTHEGDVCEGP